MARALARIEAAAGRIEAAARSPSPAAPASLVLQASGDPELAEKYSALRRETRAALAELDSLIGSLRP